MEPRTALVLFLACLACAHCSREPTPVIPRADPPVPRGPDRTALASPYLVHPGLVWVGRAAVLEPGERIAWLERSLATPLSRAEMETISEPSAINPFSLLEGEELRRRFRDHIRWQLVSEWSRLGNREQVQSLIEEISAECPEGVPRWSYARRAGESERDTASCVIRDRILRAEAQAERDPEYWTARAEYFAGRGEHEEAVRSFEMAVRTLPWMLVVGNKAYAAGSVALSRYVAYLEERDDKTAALALLTDQMDRHPPGSDAGFWLIRMVFDCADPSDHLPRGDAWLWSYLGSRVQWNLFEGGLIHWMAGEGGGSGEFWSRVVRLVEDGHPTRSRELGRALIRCGREERALPFLREGMRGLELLHGKRGVAAMILGIRPDDEEARKAAGPAK